MQVEGYSMERFVRAIKEGCLDQLIFFGEDSSRQAIHEFVIHYHRERNHQGLETRLIHSDGEDRRPCGNYRATARVGGLLNYYHRTAALSTTLGPVTRYVEAGSHPVRQSALVVSAMQDHLKR